jgi:MFS family permease
MSSDSTLIPHAVIVDGATSLKGGDTLALEPSIREESGTGPANALQARSLWRNTDFLLLWSGHTVSMLGTSVSQLALPMLVLAISGSPAQAGFISAAELLPYVILSLPAGALVDRWNRKLVMIICDVIRWLALGSIPLAYMFDVLTLTQLYLVALAQGSAFVFFNIAQLSCLPRVVPKTQLAMAGSLNEGAGSVAMLIGPGLSGAIIAFGRTTLVGAVLAFLVDSISYFISTISLLFIRTPFQEERVETSRRALWVEISDGLRFLWGRTTIRTIAFLAMVMNMTAIPMYLAVIMLAREHLHADPQTIGLIFSVGSVGGLVGAILAPWLQRRLRVGVLILAPVTVSALMTPVLAMATTPLMVIIGWALIDVTIPIFNVAQLAYRLTLIPDELQGRVNSVFRLLAYGGQPLGAMLGGFLLSVLDPSLVLWGIAMTVAVTVVAVACTEVRHA